jgi:hypothetical protein
MSSTGASSHNHGGVPPFPEIRPEMSTKGSAQFVIRRTGGIVSRRGIAETTRSQEERRWYDNLYRRLGAKLAQPY